MARSADSGARERLAALVRGSRARLIDVTQQLVRVASENPPGDTAAVAELAAKLFDLFNCGLDGRVYLRIDPGNEVLLG